MPSLPDTIYRVTFQGAQHIPKIGYLKMFSDQTLPDHYLLLKIPILIMVN